MVDDFLDGDKYPDEQLVLGLVVGDYVLLQHAEMLRREHFRSKIHADLFCGIVAHRDKGCKPNVEGMRREKHAKYQYVTRLIDAATRRAKGEVELAEILVRECAERIVGSIRTTQDRAIWYRQVRKACASRDIGASEHLLAVVIGEHVNRQSGRSFPGYGLLAKETGLSLKTVERGTIALRDNKHLHIDRRRPMTFVPIIRSKLEAAQMAIERKQPTMAKPAPQSPAGEEYDEEPF
jgi:hypothetical protein